jgi:hypothetical protein
MKAMLQILLFIMGVAGGYWIAWQRFEHLANLGYMQGRMEMIERILQAQDGILLR